LLPHSRERLREASREAYTRLMEQYQEFSPFKLLLYSVQAERPVAQQAGGDHAVEGQ
jgi:hypothetical protein